MPHLKGTVPTRLCFIRCANAVVFCQELASNANFCLLSRRVRGPSLQEQRAPDFETIRLALPRAAALSIGITRRERSSRARDRAAGSAAILLIVGYLLSRAQSWHEASGRARNFAFSPILHSQLKCHQVFLGVSSFNGFSS
jgi:hypothetical protein